ncbi:TlpA family protein disulfide reductase [Pedobacter polysacchareus]|uniref:TlpA family protein disulfide reductase n=1 Tax=Pedobacter polysacchareus TaxID=2861973 RepID=UPI001C997157|nr:hypothetical protein [Pedobacter polysacchareus]
MRIIKFLSFILLLSFQLNAQQKTEFSRRPTPDPTIRNLKVGDEVPEILIKKIIRDQKSNAKISDFYNQLLILDFWDTFCGSCIEALPKLDSLQQKFGNQLKILPVSYQSEAVMTSFFKNNKFVKNLKLPCVVEDKLLGSHFQYKLISHEVWIYKGKVIAITGMDYVTAKKIQTVLDGKPINWPVKNDMVSFDPKQPIFAQRETDQYNIKNNKFSGITGHRQGIDHRKPFSYDTLSNGYRTYFYNLTILQAFNSITFKLKPRSFIPHPKRLILEVKDKSKYIYTPGKEFVSDWHRENDICYELITYKPMEDKERLKYIYEDLQHQLGVSVRWEKRPIKCLVILKNKLANIDSLNATRKGGTRTVISAIPVFFLDQTAQYPPAIDETGIKASVLIEPFNSIDDLRKQLQYYGLDIIEAIKEIDVMVISEHSGKS